MLRVIGRLVGTLALALAAGCFTPSVPIPPPEPEKITFDLDLGSGSAQFSYPANPSYSGAVVYVFNRDQGEGIITTAGADGSVAPTRPFPAADGDQVVVSFELDEQIGSACVELHDGPSSSEYECSP